MKAEKDKLEASYNNAAERLELYKEMYTIKKEAYESSKTDANKTAMDNAEKKYLNYDIDIGTKLERYRYLTTQVNAKEAEDLAVKS
jgi:hypothetical protein